MIRETSSVIKIDRVVLPEIRITTQSRNNYETSTATSTAKEAKKGRYNIFKFQMSFSETSTEDDIITVLKLQHPVLSRKLDEVHLKMKRLNEEFENFRNQAKYQLLEQQGVIETLKKEQWEQQLLVQRQQIELKEHERKIQFLLSQTDDLVMSKEIEKRVREQEGIFSGSTPPSKHSSIAFNSSFGTSPRNHLRSPLYNSSPRRSPLITSISSYSSPPAHKFPLETYTPPQKSADRQTQTPEKRKSDDENSANESKDKETQIPLSGPQSSDTSLPSEMPVENYQYVFSAMPHPPSHQDSVNPSLTSSVAQTSVKSSPQQNSRQYPETPQYQNKISLEDTSARLISGGPIHVKVWHPSGERCDKTLKGHFKYVWTLCVHAGDLVSGSADKTMRVWNIDTGECKKIMKHPKEVNCITSHRYLLCSGSEDKVLRFFNVPDGKCAKELIGHSKGVQSVVSNGDCVISGGGDAEIRVWDVEKSRCSSTLKGHKSTVFSLMWEPYTKTLYSGSWDKTLKVWDLRVGTSAIRTMEDHGHCVNAICSHGGYLCSGSWDETIKVWDYGSGKCLSTLTGHKAYISSLCSHSNYLCSGSADHTIKYWKLNGDFPDATGERTVPAVEGFIDSVFSLCSVHIS